MSPTHSINQQSLAARVLAEGYARLRFPQPLEQQFRRDHLLASQPWVRLSLLVALATTTGFAIIDHSVIHASNAVPDVVRFGLQLPVILICLLATSRKLFARWYELLIQLVSPLFGVGTVLMASFARPEHVALVGSRVLLVAFFMYFMLGLRAVQAVRLNAVMAVAFAAAGLSGIMRADVATYLSFALFCANVIAFAGAYALEHANRTAFLERQLLEEVASLDGLTRLLNRQTFEVRAQALWDEAARTGKSVSVIMIDVDHFKLYNDHYGHQAGDECLRRVASAIREAMNGTQSLVGRYGGEEIVAISADDSEDSARDVADRIVDRVAQLDLPHDSSPSIQRVSVSVGATTQTPPLTESFNVMLKLADSALYTAKRDGRNRSVFVEHRRAA
ncbi:MAG TPA: GGDEF domain-containing protein [Steroidobacteraceae bacterium]|jgi:diguanylate cyclase (GGDEF)-like protein|nr:GGDEF domain-containing protein [Steroidobacteraceae bacterium]